MPASQMCNSSTPLRTHIAAPRCGDLMGCPFRGRAMPDRAPPRRCAAATQVLLELCCGRAMAGRELRPGGRNRGRKSTHRRKVSDMTVASSHIARRARSLIALALLFLLAIVHQGFAADVAALRGKHIVFVEPYGPGSVTNVPLALMRDEIARKSGATVDIVSVAGKAGGLRVDYVLSPPPAIAQDAILFPLLDIRHPSLSQRAARPPKLLQSLQPVPPLAGALPPALI